MTQLLYDYSYKGIPLKSPTIFKNKEIYGQKNRAIAKCSCCGKEVETNIPSFKKSIDEFGKFYCGECRVKIKAIKRECGSYYELLRNKPFVVKIEGLF